MRAASLFSSLMDLLVLRQAGWVVEREGLTGMGVRFSRPGVSPGGLGDFEKKMIKSFELPL